MKKLNWKKFLFCMLLPLLIEAVSFLIVRTSLGVYEVISKPVFAPPLWVFYVVGTLVNIIIGFSSYLILMKSKIFWNNALQIYFLSISLNFFLPIIFFYFQLFLIAFVWLLIIDVLTVLMLIEFKKISKHAFYLQLPYITWNLILTIFSLCFVLLNL